MILILCIPLFFVFIGFLDPNLYLFGWTPKSITLRNIQRRIRL